MESRYGAPSRAEQFELDRLAGDRIIRRNNLHKSLPLALATPIVAVLLVEFGGHVLNHLYRHSSLNPDHTTNPAAAAKMTLLSGEVVTLLAVVFALVATIRAVQVTWGGSRTRLEKEHAARVGRQARHSHP